MAEVVKIGEKGQITLPKRMREKGGLEKGQSLEVKYLGEGAFFLTSVDRKREAEIAFRLLGKRLDFSNKSEVIEYCRKIRREVFEEWSES